MRKPGKKNRLSALVPPGVNARLEFRLLLAGLAAAGLFSLTFVNRYVYNVRVMMFYSTENTWDIQLSSGSYPVDRMFSFQELLGHALAGFGIVGLAMGLLCFVHWYMHHHRSKSLYLLRRLPQRGELLRRTCGLPFLGFMLSAVCSEALYLIYYAVYDLVTPAELLALML